ncbi:MAG TPA: hypothetical protein VES60_06415 [Nakamurella sp.]|nr:hypothetical protein [Nakamurella sp.]
MMHPVGPQTPKVYWVRRVAAVVLAVAVLIGMVWFLATRSSRSSAVSEAAVNAATSAAAPTLTGELAGSTAISPVPTKSSAVSGSVAPSASGTGFASAGSPPVISSVPVSSAPSAAASDPAASDPAASDPAAAAAPAASEPAAATPAATPEATAATPEAPAPAAAPAPAPAPPPPSYDAQGKLLCADADISLTAAPSAAAFAVGDQPRLLLIVTNSGTQVCQRDVSGSLQTFIVFGADGSRIFSTADCFPGTGTEVRELTPGQQLQYTIKWSGTTSAPGCTGERSAAPAGSYTVIGQLGGLSSPPAPFTVTG